MRNRNLQYIVQFLEDSIFVIVKFVLSSNFIHFVCFSFLGSFSQLHDDHNILSQRSLLASREGEDAFQARYAFKNCMTFQILNNI